MTKDEETVTKILLDISHLSGKMIESSQTGVIRLNNQPTLLIDPKFMNDTGQWLAKKVKDLSHLVSAIQNENNTRDTPSTASE